MNILAMTQGDKYWNETINLAEKCSWKAGPYLAELMKQNKFLEWERVIVALEDEKVVGYCTFCEKDELPEIYEFTPFIGFMFVDEKYRGKRISEMLIRKAIVYAKELGFEYIYIMSGELGLYEKYGFEKIGDYETIYNSVDQLFKRTTKL
jgi:predicted N-acetyltransferase YhbS